MSQEFTGFAQLRSRYGAFLIDTVLFLALWFMGALLAGSIGLEFNRWNAFALAAAYFGLFPATPLQGTPGKRACGIRVTDLAGAPLRAPRALARFAASVPSIGLLGIGFLPAAWTARRQSLHDLVAGTLVVDVRASPAEIAGSIAAPISWFGRAAVCVVVLASGLFVYAQVEFYHAVVARDRFGLMWDAFNDYRPRVEEALVKRTPMPPPRKPDAIVKALRANADGSIVLEPPAELSAGGRYVFTPNVEADRVTWKCVATDLDARFVPYSCRE